MQISKTFIYNIQFNLAIKSIFNLNQNNELITYNNKVYYLTMLHVK